MDILQNSTGESSFADNTSDCIQSSYIFCKKNEDTELYQVLLCKYEI
jgi:hypothetical protein